MIRTLDRLVSATFVGLFTRFIISIPILFIIADVRERYDYYLSQEIARGDIALGYLFRYPHFMLWSFPVAALVATVFTVHTMTVHREITAAKGGGISFHRLMAPLWVLGVLLTGAAFWLGTVVPQTNRKAAEIFKEREIRREYRQNFVHETENGETLSVQQFFVGTGTMENVLLESRNDDGTLRHVWATNAVHTEDGWTFNEGYLRMIGPGDTEATFDFMRYRPSGLTVQPEELLEEPRDEEEMTYAELKRQAEIVYRSGGDPKELRVKQEQKLAIPAATFVIILFGAPLATTAKAGGATFGVGVSLASTLLYILLLQLSGAIGATGGLPPLWAAWTPNLIFLVAASALLARVRT